MTETTTPTDEVVDQSSSDIRDESVLDNDNEQDSAVGQNEDTDSSESQGSDSEDSSSADESSDEDKGLAKFAKSQGFDPDNLTDGERKALKIAHDNQKAFRKKSDEKANQKKVDQEIQELYQPDENDGVNETVLKKMAIMEAKDYTREFWDKHQDDRTYESKMVEVLIKEKEQYGEDAARLLSQNLPRLLREAKDAAGAFDSDAARDAGRREERERLRKNQEGSADGAHATQSTAASSGKLTREKLDSMSHEEYVKIRDSGELDAAIQRGDLY